MKICPKCATENADTANFCDECGTELINTIQDSLPAQEESYSSENDNPSSEVPEVKDFQKENSEKDFISSNQADDIKLQFSDNGKKKPRVLKWLIIVTIIIIAFIYYLSRPTVEDITISYEGDMSEGVVLDDANPGFVGSVTYSDGTKKDIPRNQIHIKEPKTLKADSTETVTILYKNQSAEMEIECSTTVIKSISAEYNGPTYEGTRINEHSDIIVTGTYGNGDIVEIKYWSLSPKEATLKKNISEHFTVKVTFDDGTSKQAAFTVTGIENELKSIDAEYTGSKYAGTVINRESDIEVEGKYADEKWRDIDKEDWSLDPESVTLEDGKTSKLKVIVKQDNGNTISTDIEIEGKEKPFTKPEIEGEHYNCSIDQFISYINKNTTFTLFPMDITVVGDDYKAYGMIPPKGAELDDDEALILAVRENADGKLSNIVVWSTDKITGMATSLRLAQIFDYSINSDDGSAIASFLLSQVYEGDDMIIYVEEASDHYTTYLMSRDFYNNNVKQ